MKMLSNTETELKKTLLIKKACIWNPVKHVKCSFLRKKKLKIKKEGITILVNL